MNPLRTIPPGSENSPYKSTTSVPIQHAASGQQEKQANGDGKRDEKIKNDNPNNTPIP